MRHPDSVDVVFEHSRKATGGRKRANERQGDKRNGAVLEVCRIIGIKHSNFSKYRSR